MVRKIGSCLLLSFYILFSLVSLSNCSRSDNSKSTSEKLADRKLLLSKLLEHEYNAAVFDAGLENYKQRNIVFDSTVLAVSKRGENVYLKTMINTGLKESHFGFFKCSREVYDQFSKTKTNNLLLVAKVEGVQRQSISALSDSLEGKFKELKMGHAVLITGQCLALTEVPFSAAEI